MVGYPGAGKTTIAQHIHNLTGAAHIWGDKERIARFKHPHHTEKESRSLYRQLNGEVAALLDSGKSVVFDTNFSFRRDRDHMREIARQAGTDCKVIWVTTPKDVAKRRAVEESENKPTRLWGNMAASVFSKLVAKQEDPGDDERPIDILGIGVTEDTVKAALDI